MQSQNHITYKINNELHQLGKKSFNPLDVPSYLFKYLSPHKHLITPSLWILNLMTVLHVLPMSPLCTAVLVTWTLRVSLNVGLHVC